MQSVWQKYINNSPSGRRGGTAGDGVGNQELDTVIVGGGIAGIMCAYMLSQNGHKVTLIEAHKLLSGVTSHTTAHVSAFQPVYQDIPTNKKRRLYFQSQINAVEGIAKLVSELKIDCDFKRADSWVFAQSDRDVPDLKKEYKVLRKFHAPVEYHGSRQMAIGTYPAIRLNNQAVFNPIKFCQGILSVMAKEVPILENTRIKKVCLMRKTLKTEKETFKYKRVIFATGFPIVNIRGLYAFKMYKSFSYSICAQTETKLGAQFGEIAKDGFTYRDSTDGIIIGGLDHRTGRWKCKKYFDILKEESKRLGGKVAHEWCANDCMTFDHVPYAGRMFCLCRSAFMISGFNKWGMANAYVGAELVANLVDGERNRYKKIFKPTRILHISVWPAFFWNFLQDGLGLLAGLFSSKKRRCPHMGCRLKFNPNTQTYDCPCHGSRFTENGDIIVSPAVDANEVLARKNP